VGQGLTAGHWNAYRRLYYTTICPAFCNEFQEEIMTTQMNVKRLEKTGNKWMQAIVRTYSVSDVLLTPRAIQDMNGEHNEIVFELAQHMDDDEWGQVTLLNVYARDEACFAQAEEIIGRMEQRIAEYRRSQDTFHFYAETVDLLKNDMVAG
jgi:hypothetical protein